MFFEANRIQQNASLVIQPGEDTARTTVQAKNLGMDDSRTVSATIGTETAAAERKQTAETFAEKREKAAAQNIAGEKTEKRDGFTGKVPQCQCETCRRRRYQDDSNDNGVSCQTPTKMDPTAASFKVKAHEMEHVRREQMKAKEEGSRLVSQSVRIMTDRCEECGTTYVSGGYTRTVVKADFSDVRELLAPYDTGDEEAEQLIGRA